MSARHVDALTCHSDGVRLAAVCDTDYAKAEAYATALGVPAFRTADEMYRAVPLDLVDIATPSGLHYEHALEALTRGINAVVEKPLCLRPEQAERLIAEAEGRGLKLWVSHQNRYNPALRAAKDAVTSGRFGRMVAVTVRLRWCREQGYYDQDDWHGTWKMDGGVLSQQAIHHLDALRWIGGEIESVEATCATRLVRMECEDTCVATVVFKSGALGAIEAMTSARPNDIEASVSVLGEHGTVVVGGLAMNRIEHWRFVDRLPEDDKAPDRYSIEVPNAYGFGHNDLFTRAARSVTQNAPVEIDGRAGLETLRLLHALYASNEQGCRVRLSDAPVSSRLGVG